MEEKFKSIIEEIEKMSVLDLNELVKLLEKKFGVSAQAVAVGAASAGSSGEPQEEQSMFTVHLASVGDNKINVIKAVKEAMGLGLKEAKDMVEGAPIDVKAGVKKEEAQELKKKLEASGAKVELK